jgi:hypothetical protein
VSKDYASNEFGVSSNTDTHHANMN